MEASDAGLRGVSLSVLAKNCFYNHLPALDLGWTGRKSR